MANQQADPRESCDFCESFEGLYQKNHASRENYHNYNEKVTAEFYCRKYGRTFTAKESYTFNSGGVRVIPGWCERAASIDQVVYKPGHGNGCPPSITGEVEKRVLELIDQYKDDVVIGKAVGLSNKTIWDYRRKHGIPEARIRKKVRV